MAVVLTTFIAIPIVKTVLTSRKKDDAASKKQELTS
jgi:hypothetical protein